MRRTDSADVQGKEQGYQEVSWRYLCDRQGVHQPTWVVIYFPITWTRPPALSYCFFSYEWWGAGNSFVDSPSQIKVYPWEVMFCRAGCNQPEPALLLRTLLCMVFKSKLMLAIVHTVSTYTAQYVIIHMSQIDSTSTVILHHVILVS